MHEDQINELLDALSTYLKKPIEVEGNFAFFEHKSDSVHRKYMIRFNIGRGIGIEGEVLDIQFSVHKRIRDQDFEKYRSLLIEEHLPFMYRVERNEIFLDENLEVESGWVASLTLPVVIYAEMTPEAFIEQFNYLERYWYGVLGST